MDHVQRLSAPNALSLFAGGGGLDLGVSQAGFDVRACIEIDPHACETLRANKFSGATHRVIEADIREIDPVGLRRELGIRRGALGLLCGGPPCQTFSQIGKQEGVGDSRGLLLFEMARFADAFRPHAVLIENVKGLVKAKGPSGRPGEVLDQLCRDLESLGYSVSTAVLRAADYGVPQVRDRVFIVALRTGIPFSFPEPTHTANTSTLLGGAPYTTVAQALAGLPSPVPKGEEAVLANHVDITPTGDRRRIAGVPEGSHLAKCLHLPAEQRGRLTRKDTTKFRRLHSDLPSNTLRCGEVFFHTHEDRYLTPREYMRLHGFPDDYELKGPMRGRSGRVKHLDQHRLVANSVPPPIACILAAAIKEQVPSLRRSRSTDTRSEKRAPTRIVPANPLYARSPEQNATVVQTGSKHA